MNRRFMLSIALVVFVLSLTVGCKKEPVVVVKKQDPVVVDTTPKDTIVDTWVEPIDTTVIIPVENVDSLIKANLSTVYFEVDSYELTDASMDQVIASANFLKLKSNLRIRLDGHCDERGSSEYNMGLGERRALVIRKLLTDYEVDSRRIETTSFGKEQLLTYGCADDECHGKNRRVEFTVVQR